MHVDVNGGRLWFDVDGPGLVPSGPDMHLRPTVVLVHGGPGSFDHSYFKPAFYELTAYAQVVYLDLRGHGQNEGDPAGDERADIAPRPRMAVVRGAPAAEE